MNVDECWTLLEETPVGPLLLTARDGALTGLSFDPGPERQGHRDDMAPVLRAAREQLEEYFAGRRCDFDLPILADGTPFQKRVWEQLRKIPYGKTISYGELARRIDQPTAFRAVGLANGRNPVAIVVPCHRVVGANGALIGFGGGMERKRVLLDLERESATLF